MAEDADATRIKRWLPLVGGILAGFLVAAVFMPTGGEVASTSAVITPAQIGPTAFQHADQDSSAAGTAAGAPMHPEGHGGKPCTCSPQPAAAGASAGAAAAAATGAARVPAESATSSITPSVSASPTPSATPPPSTVLGALDNEGFTRKLDGIEGPTVHKSWLPKRHSAKLPLAAGKSADVIVDSYWHLYHGGLKALNWPEQALGNPMLGAPDEGRAGFGGSAKSAPPLPNCVPLTGGALQHPLQDSVANFPDYDMSPIVKRGADPDGYIASMADPAVSGVAAGDPAPKVRALLWHRLVHVDAELYGRDFHGNDTTPYFASYTPVGRQRFCAGKGGYMTDLEPEENCDGGKRPSPPVQYPYCNRGTAPVAVVSFDCAYTESNIAANVIVWNEQTLDAGGRVISHNNRRWQLPRGQQIVDHDELGCAGTSVYPDAPGHFFNEILPRLIHLDTILPAHIPLMWAAGRVPEGTLEELRKAGVVSANRQFIPTSGTSVHRARRLYTYASEYPTGHTPLILATSQRIFASRLHTAVREMDAAERASNPALPPLVHNGIIVLTRRQGHSRSMVNEGDLVNALRANFPGVPVEAFEPGSAPQLSFLNVARKVYGARVIIGPHGANLNNQIGARPGAWLIEIGYNGGMAMPSDYFGLARNLGLRYWMSPSEWSSYDSPMSVFVDDVVDIVRRAFAEPAPAEAPNARALEHALR